MTTKENPAQQTNPIQRRNMGADVIADRIYQLAIDGLSPYEIETRLGMQHYTIHLQYHAVLMQGYSFSKQYFKTRTNDGAGRKIYMREYRQINKAKISKRQHEYYEANKEKILAKLQIERKREKEKRV